ncbi:MAG: DoxX family protein [Candidatus Kapabacteria bacterium]|nr:DoxX family protein [Candidatus Kapabacteria bacterium]
MSLLHTLTQTGNIHLAYAAIRVWVGAMMFYHGFVKIEVFDKFVENVTLKQGMPEFLAYAAFGAELIGGALLVIGLFTRPAAFLIAVTMAVAAFKIHAVDPWQKKEFALAYLIPALGFLLAGGGLYSIDSKLAQRFSHQGN